MKILLVVPSLRKTGLTEVVKSLVESIDREQVDFTLVALTKSNDTLNESIFKKLCDVEIINYQYLGIPSIIKFLKIVNYTKPAIIHFHGFKADLYSIFINKNKIKLMSTSHNIGNEDFIYNYGHFCGYLMNKVQIFIFKRMNEVCGVSQYVTNNLINQGVVKARKVLNGVKMNKLNNNFVINQPIVRPVGIYVGNIDNRKNVLNVLDGFSKQNEKKQGTLLILGDGPEYRDLKRKFESERIFFLGRVNNVDDFLNISNYFISASKSEGLPMASIEAMGNGLDLILSDIQQHKELRISNSQKIYFFANSVKNDIQITLANYLSEFQAKSVKENENSKIFSEYFTSTVMASKYTEVYNNLKN
ncbi:hypothetical protein FC70_GL000122 [Paucilactobacillus oligofermentans DSM 15707 = LMG 22743]|uniref:Glycosyltransferase n=1 Tax=Paucilactobacillus oligofermentans DSM 15707 = LMG 22743 TaxID=1423778 RepID=A0A0R1RN57_9LACO|nr:glycosyltransferase [Paucilactobacillus oligofermentans]KRL58049.1 hypothetical protein FC70_GL000122 [Paucilactobacillus oligofermentans DSM 15707 = LMG 22743]CUS26955.1 Glycosyltransferase [Paucilactobacillus oligofermentans DSM 15707 = LMG 22743]